MRTDDKKDYSGVWIDLMAEVKILHHYCLSGDWATASKVAKNCGVLSEDLATILKEMSELK
jgi:hypothetical protein